MPIDRPVLSKNMKKKGGDLALREPEFFEGELAVDCFLGSRAISVDPGKKLITHTVDGQLSELFYNRCLVCTGGRARVPETLKNGEHCYFLRSAADADRLDRATKNQEPVVVIGGGFIGVECAGTLARKGCSPVTLVTNCEVPFERVLGREIGHAIAEFLRKKILSRK